MEKTKFKKPFQFFLKSEKNENPISKFKKRKTGFFPSKDGKIVLEKISTRLFVYI